MVISNFVTDIAPIVSVLEVKFIDLFTNLNGRGVRDSVDEEENGTRRLLFTSTMEDPKASTQGASMLKGINHTPNQSMRGATLEAKQQQQ